MIFEIMETERSIVLKFLNQSGKFIILSTWDTEIGPGKFLKSYHVKTTTSPLRVSILNELILSDFELFKSWLLNLRSSILVEDFVTFVRAKNPDKCI